jgi:hypothetical protein
VKIGRLLARLRRGAQVAGRVIDVAAPIVEEEGISTRGLRKLGDGLDRALDAVALADGTNRLIQPMDDFFEEAKALDADVVLVMQDPAGAELVRLPLTALQRNAVDAVFDGLESARARLAGLS